MEFIRARLKYSNCLTINKVGRSGGLILLWTEDISSSVSSYSSSHINAMVSDYDGNI